MASTHKYRLAMNCPVTYRVIMKFMLGSKKDEVIDIVAYCHYAENKLYRCQSTADGPESDIYENNINGVYAHTGPIYKLLYL